MAATEDESIRSLLHRLTCNNPITVNHRALIDKVLTRYPSKWAVFRELIANAADASAKTVKIRIITSPRTNPRVDHRLQRSLNYVIHHNVIQRIVVHNDGRPFQEEDWNRLTSIAEGNPGDQSIGMFGLGFYSVFKLSDEPVVCSKTEALIFKWEGKTLYSSRIPLPPEKHIDDTRVELEYSNADVDVPDLIEIGQFLATSLMSVDLLQIELWLDEWMVLSLGKSVRNKSIASTADFKMNTEHMEIQNVETGIMQIDGYWLNSLYRDITTPLLAQVTASHVRGYLIDKSSETPRTALEARLAAQSFSTTESHSRTLTREQQPLEQSTIREQNLNSDEQPSVQCASVCMRITTATVSTKFHGELALGIEAVIKKKPTHRTYVSILTSCGEQPDPCPFFEFIIPSRKHHGKILVGFSTLQTSGLQAHIMMQSILTLERELIDLTTDHVRVWNKELLQVAGIIGRIVWAEEMNITKNYRSNSIGPTLKKEGWTPGRKGLTLVNRNEQLSNARRLFRQFDFQASAPHSEVISIIEEYFWKACEYIDIISTQGVYRSTEVRLENTHVAEFANCYPILPGEFIDKYKNFVRKLKSAGFISEVTNKDIETELSSKTINERQLEKLFIWASKNYTNSKASPESKESIVSTMKAATVKISQSSKITLGKVEYFAAYKLPNELLPPHVIPFTYSQIYGMSDWFQGIGWKPLPVLEWLRRCERKVKEFMNNPAGAENVLAVISSNLKPEDYAKAVGNLPLVPTDNGMRVPAEAYFRSAVSFEGLPYVKDMTNVSEKFLETLGVRRTVKMNTIVQHLGSVADQPDMFQKYLSYLIAIPQPLPDTDLQKLSTASIWYAERRDQKKGHTRARYMLTELCEPSDELRGLKIPTLYLPQGYRQEGLEGRFLRSAGLRRHPSVSELIKILDEDDQLERLELCVSYLIRKFALPSEEDKKTLSSARIWHAEDSRGLKGCRSEKKYVLSELFEPLDQLRGLELQVLYLPQGYRPRGPEGDFFRTLGIRRRLSIPDLIRIMGETEKPHLLEVCIAYLIDSLRSFSHADREALYNAPIWYAEAENGKGFESHKKYTLDKLFEPSDSMRELKVPTLYLPQGYRHDGLEGQFFRPFGLKSYPSAPELISIITTAISQGDYALRDHGLSYFIKHFEVNGYRAYDLNSSTAQFLPLEGSQEDHARPGECFTNGKAAVLGFPILRKDLHGMAIKFTVKFDPPLSVCIDRLVENPPQTRDTAEEVYTYLITSFREELPCHHKRLRTSAIVPIFPRQEADRTPSNTVHNKTTLLRPPECFIGNLDGEIMEIADLFRCEYYGGKAAEFLTLCGAPKTPTGDHIAEKFLADPQRVLEVLRSPEAYDRWFASLGKRYRSGDICVKLRNDMRKARFLLTITYDTQENTATRCWSTAEEAIVVDDINLFNHFRPHLNAVVQDDGVESFSELLNSKKLSSIVRQRYEITSPASGPKADHWRSRILTRSKIFLHDIGLSRTKVSWEELESHLQVRVAESIDRYFVLGDVICHDKTNATATKNSEDYVVTIVPDDDLPYSLGGELAKLFVKKPKVADALLFESIFQKTLDALQRRGYNTDRILGLNQQIVSQSPLQLRVEEQRVTITETQEVGNAERGRKKTQGTVSASSYQYVERLTVEHETNRSHSRGLGRTLHREETKSPYRPWVLPRNRQESSQNSNEFINMDVGVIINPFPITIFADEDDEDTRYFGELYMSRFLTSFLGPEFYKPNKHWTSHLRSRNGHTRYRKNPSSSTFTIRERHGKLGHFILQWRDDISFYKSCKFHIEVSATNGDLHSQFILSNPQFVKAQELTLDDITEVKEVYILARVYKVCENPGIALYLDPWRLHRDGLISLQSQSSYEGRISKAAPAMLVVDSANHSFSGRPHKFYEGLDVGPGEIRLLKLTLDEDSVPLRGSLIITSVDSSDPFWAISYFWGPKPTPLSPFYFHTSLGKIPITESLATCLQYLRHRRVSVYLWADAVCINQRNSIEKNMQVRSMGSLYSKAERVIVWMGDKREEDYHALDLLNKLQGPSEGPPAWDTSANDDLWNGINNFLQRPWFTRTWIIQELVLGRKVSVMCGNSEIGWDELIRGITECQNRLNRTGLGGGDKLFLPNSWRALNLDCIRKHFNNHLKFSFLELLEMFYYTRTSDPRDKLFALLNMAYDTGIGREAFFPDYDSTEEVILANYAKQFVELGSVLDLLYRAGTDKGSNFCTWIPDLMNQQRKAQYPPTISTWEAAGSGTQPGFRAARFLPKAQVQRDIAVKNHVIPILSIMGILFDSIWSCHPLELGSGNTGIQFSNTLRDLRQKIWDLNSYPNASKNWKEELLIKCLIGDAIRPHTKPCWPFSDQSQQAQPLRWPEGFEQELLGLRPDQDAHEYAAKSPESLAVIDQFWQTAANFTDRIPHATVCITKEGYMGIVPGSTLPGDKIFIADGAKVPFVLKKDTDTAFHKLIGECYIHGLMYHSDYTTKDLKHEEVFIV